MCGMKTTKNVDMSSVSCVVLSCVVNVDHASTSCDMDLRRGTRVNYLDFGCPALPSVPSVA